MNEHMSRIITFAFVIVSLSSIIMIIMIPHWQVAFLQHDIERLQVLFSQQHIDKIQIDNLRDIAILEKSRLDAENAARAVISQGTGGFFIFLTALISFLNYLQTRRNVTLSEEKQITERFAKAVEMLGHTDIHIRLGAIYALERIANDSDKDYWQIMEILTAYVRVKSPYQYTGNIRQNSEYEPFVPLPIDIQTVLTVIGRRRNYGEGEVHSLDLSGSNLRGARLEEKANLNNVNFMRANLSDVYFKKVELKGVNFYQANLDKANLQQANLSNAELGCTKLSKAILAGANLMGAKLGCADLSYSALEEADFSDAYFVAADILYTSFYNAKNLTPTQVQKAINWEKAYYDLNLLKQLGIADTNTTSENNS